MVRQLMMATKNKAPRIRYRCPSCARKHDGLPALAYGRPDAIFNLGTDEQKARAVTASDLCILDDERYFVRCVLQIGVAGSESSFEYGPWVEVDVRTFSRYAIHCNTGQDPGWKVADGRLANAFPANTEGTLGVACRIRLSEEPRQRPTVEITDKQHPLFREQRDGISMARAIEIVSHMKGFVLLVD